MNNLIFLNKIYFLLLIPLLLIIAFLFFKKKNKVKFLFFEDLKKVYKKSSIFYYGFFILIIIMSVLYVIIIANPNTKNSTENIMKNGIDIVLVFDVSYSMEATDLKPSRIEVARDVLSSFLWNLKTDRVWVVVFSGKPFTSIPLTFDYGFLKDYVSKLTTETINQNNTTLQWTAIWDAMLMWTYLFDEKSIDREKVMIIVTDWEANKWLEPNIALKLLKDKNVKAYTVWVWWLEKSYVTVLDNFWRKLQAELWWIDEKSLKNIANETWWKYYRATSKEVFNTIFSDIDKLEKKDIEVEIKKLYDTKYEYFYYLLLIMQTIFVLLVLKKVRI